MKLQQVLTHTNQVERAKFVNCVDKLCSIHAEKDKNLAKQLSNIDGQLRAASDSEINQLFNLVKEHYFNYLKEQVALGGSQVSLLINILARDGNSIARISWLESLYDKEYKIIDTLSKSLIIEIESSEDDSYDRASRLSIYKDCYEVAFFNDLKSNRTAKVSDDERTILNVLADRLSMSREEVFAIEHSIDPIPKGNLEDALNFLREIGVVFINKRRSEVLIAEETVNIVHELLGKELSDKYVLRILRSLNDAELSAILRAHGHKSRGVTRSDKIQTISHSGLPIRNLLQRDVFPPEATQNQRKERIKALFDELDLSVSKLGTTLSDRVDILINVLTSSNEEEFNSLSASGFKELLTALSETTPKVEDRIRIDFEIESNENLDPERLRALGITPVDLLYLYSNDEVKAIRNDLGLPKKGNPRTEILQSFASANDRLVENYELLACRDLAGLSTAGIDIKESEIGVKFEEITRSILEQLNMNVDEDLRKEINTAKDKADIIVSLSNDDVIIGEAKSFKNGDYAKYSSTSRQVKAYANRCEVNGHRVAQVLIIAPSFSQDFIDSADMDTDINISLLEASGLKKILTAFKARRNPNFTPKLLTKGGLLKADLISKAI